MSRNEALSHYGEIDDWESFYIQNFQKICRGGLVFLLENYI